MFGSGTPSVSTSCTRPPFWNFGLRVRLVSGVSALAVLGQGFEERVGDGVGEAVFAEVSRANAERETPEVAAEARRQARQGEGERPLDHAPPTCGTLSGKPHVKLVDHDALGAR